MRISSIKTKNNGWKSNEGMGVNIIFESNDFLSTLRNYQIDAFNSVINAYKHEQKRYLLSMATGTGRSMVSIAVANFFLEHRIVDKIVFGFDRIDLANQMYSRLCQLLPDINISRDNIKDNSIQSKIIVSTSQELLKKEFYTIGFSLKEKVLIIHHDIYIKKPKLFDDFINYFNENCYLPPVLG